MGKVLGAVVLAGLAALILLLSQDKDDMEKFEWFPTESAPVDFPMQILRGVFVLGDGSTAYVPDGKVFNNGWGRRGSTHIVNETRRSLPESLDLLWFSYAENRFFHGRFDLPAERIHALVRHGFDRPSTGEPTTFDRIIVGVAPEGEVALWLAGAGIVREVANFKAQETDADWKQVLDNEQVSREAYVEMVLEESIGAEATRRLQATGVPSGRWARYRTRYGWSLEIIGAEPLLLWLDTFNGESEFFDFAEIVSTRNSRACPQEMRINWRHSNGQTYTSTIDFDEQETFSAFEKLDPSNPDGELHLRLEISQKSLDIDTFLLDPDFLLELEKSTTITKKLQ